MLVLPPNFLKLIGFGRWSSLQKFMFEGGKGTKPTKRPRGGPPGGVGNRP